jgi:signal transduction histidine kinase
LLADMLKSYPEFQPPRAEVRLEGEFPRVLGNEAGLTQCFSNLLSNAVKFVPPGRPPCVRIRAERVEGLSGAECEVRRAESVTIQSPQSKDQSGWVRIWFEDNGTGIPRGGEKKIFDMFRRMHGSDYEGTGIGLALVRKVMERMGGRVGVESEEGKGSRFWIELRTPNLSTGHAGQESPVHSLAA